MVGLFYNRAAAIKSFLILTFVVIFLSAGCQQDNFNAIYSNKVTKIKEGITSKAQAAESLQSIIADAYGISVQHVGFKANTIPPIPLPKWTPQQVLDVNESMISTRYLEQHWHDESIDTKVAGVAAYGYTTTITHWQGYLGEKTLHSVEIPFANVKQISVERPVFYEYSIVKLYYTSPSGQFSSESKIAVFKIWILNNQKEQSGIDACLAALSVLCPNVSQ